MATLNTDPRKSVEVNGAKDILQTRFPPVALNQADGGNSQAGQFRWEGPVEIASLSTARPRAWHNELSAVPQHFYRQILGLNPFRTSYFALYRPLNDWQSRFIIIAGFVLAIAAGVPLPIIGVLFGKIINNFPPPEDELKTRLGQLLGTASLYFVFTWGWAVCWGTVGERLSRKMREELVERILGMDPGYFDLQTPDITQILTEKSQTIQLGTSEKVGLFLQSVSYFVAAFCVGFILDARLTGILLVAIIPSMGLVVYLGTKLISKYAKRASHYSREASTIAESAIKAVQVVQAFGVADTLCQNHSNQRNAAFAQSFRKALSGALMLGCIYFVAYSANALAFWQGHRQFNEQSGNSGQAGTVYAVVFLILDASFVVGQFGPFIQTFALAASAGTSIFDILDHPCPHIDVYSKDGQQTNGDTFSHDITFKDVTFVYPARPMLRILESLNLVIRPGITTGLVGASGSGKSTIASLLLRLYDCSSGSIMIGSKDIRQFNLKNWRSHIALVDQHSFLFSGTILDNISDGLGYHHGLPKEDVLELCTKAAADANCDFIANLPDGLYTAVGASGTQLSGGQKQRICLARALIADPRILILDEYTSAMDATSESLVVDALNRTSARSGRTTIIIAHRLATVKDADQIVVFGDGAVIEEGSHKDLIEFGGAYSGLVDAQKFDKTLSSAEPSIRRVKSDFNSVNKSAVNSASTLPGPQMIDKGQAEKVGTIRVLRQCLMLSRPDLLFVLLGILASVISGAIVMGEAIVFGNLVRILNSTSSKGESDQQANFYCLMFFILALIALFSYSVSGIAFGIVSERFIRRVQDISLRTILAQDIAWFSEKDNSAHALISRLNRDVGNISGLSNVILGTIVSVFTSVIGGIVLAHYVAWKIAIVLLAAVPVMLLAGFFRLHVLSKAEERHQTAYIGASALASEACANIRTVAILGREGHTLELYRQSLKKTCENGLRFTIFANVLLAFSLSITYFVYALAYWWGSKQVREGAYSILDFFIVLPALLFSAQAAGQMFSLAPEITKAKFAARSVFDLHDEKPTINKVSVAGHSKQTQSSPATSSHGDEKVVSTGNQQLGSIELRNVSLIYPTRQNTIALDDVSLSISPGQFVAFVGRSGAGKTSLISLLERFIDPTAGSVCIDANNIRDIDVGTHRNRISLVEQEPDLFPGSVLFNVSLGVIHGQQATPKQVEDICKKVGLHEFVMSLPEGYNTECGSNGSRLSGGQRQRIALARALLRDPKILLLDEATSQLDANTEQAIQHAVAAAASGRTTIMVAHRLSSIQHADNIFVFDDGRLVEQGTHDELVVLGGIYASMVAAQELC